MRRRSRCSGSGRCAHRNQVRPDLRVQGQGQGQTATTSVALNLTLSPSYSTRKPGVVVTMTSCNNASLKLLRHVGSLGAGQSLQAQPGRIV